MFEVGADINYTNSMKEIYSGRVLEIKKRVKISYFHSDGTKIRWVNPNNVALRDTNRCAHNDECGWCADSGKCIYQN